MAIESTIRRSPLGPFADMLRRGSGPQVQLTELPPAGLAILRGDPARAGFVATIRDAAGIELPTEPNRFRAAGGWTALWLGPDEWLLLGPDGAAASLEATVRRALPDDPWLALVDVSQQYCGFRLAGPAARRVLAKGCPLDLHPRAFGEGQGAQTLLARTRMILLQAGDEPTFEIRIRNSFARYAAGWLLDAMAEFTA